MKKKLLLSSILLFGVTGCLLNPKINFLLSTPGYLVDYPETVEIDNRIAKSLNEFSVILYNELYKDNENIFISPASIYLALGMTVNGANGDTYNQMIDVLKANDYSLEELNKLNKSLQSLILSYEKTNTALTNSIWIRDTYHDKVKESFINRNKEYYGPMISTLDFNDSRAKDTINNWVKKNTNNLIDKIIEEDIDPLTVMFLINTIYFKADWENQFEKENTTNREFINSTGKVNIPTMNKIDSLGYIKNDKLEGVLLPYKGNETSMFIIMPEEGINNYYLNGNVINLIEEMKKNKVNLNLYMPKVDIDYKASLKDPFINLGMTIPFTGNADFSEMANNAVEDGLHIADILHKTVLKIDEKGTEAAAATSVEMKLEMAPRYDYTLKIDKPFILGIIDNKNDAILFLGGINEL
ncbi:MAG: serpin family protein [Bacilli bacterium]|nr:serpin family protein [Bacilli bacterium]